MNRNDFEMLNSDLIYFDNGATTLEEVQEATGAGTVCGACLEDVQRLVDQFVGEKE